jgi:hypothetical protein
MGVSPAWFVSLPDVSGGFGQAHQSKRRASGDSIKMQRALGFCALQQASSVQRK